jgi:putative endonuclease
MALPNIILPLAEWRDPRHRRGLAGELWAARHLESQGWRIEAHRYRFGRHDIDLVARRNHLVTFIEVKTRASHSFGPGSESVGWKKRAQIELVARSWISRRGRPSDHYRFDVVLVWVGQGTFPQVIHIEDAWRTG